MTSDQKQTFKDSNAEHKSYSVFVWRRKRTYGSCCCIQKEETQLWKPSWFLPNLKFLISYIYLGPHGLYSPPGFSVHGISRARILEWVAILFSRGSSWPRNQVCVSCMQADSLLSEPPGRCVCVCVCVSVCVCVRTHCNAIISDVFSISYKINEVSQHIVEQKSFARLPMLQNFFFFLILVINFKEFALPYSKSTFYNQICWESYSNIFNRVVVDLVV